MGSSFLHFKENTSPLYKRFWDSCPRGKLPHNPNPNPNLNQNPNPNREAIFLVGNCPDTIKT